LGSPQKDLSFRGEEEQQHKTPLIFGHSIAKNFSGVDVSCDVVGEEGLEPSSLAATDFKSAAYTNSATRPLLGIILQRTLTVYRKAATTDKFRNKKSKIALV
jgi:hypothetical protein